MLLPIVRNVLFLANICKNGILSSNLYLSKKGVPMKTQQQLFDFLKHNSIQTQTYEHEPVYTVEQSKKVKNAMHGASTKNLFLKDDRKKIWLVTAHADAIISIKLLGRYLKAKKLRFAQAELLQQYLGVAPGSVTPFGLINDTNHVVTAVLDATLFDYDLVGVHPLVNSATTTIAPQDLKTFIDACGNRTIIVDFEQLNQESDES